MKLKAEETSEFDLIDEGQVIPARLEGVEHNTFKWEGENVEKLRWTFAITEQGQWYGKAVSGSTSTAFTAHPNCKAYNWAVAISGHRYADGEELETDDILAMPCQVVIKHRKDKQGRIWMDVRDVLPPSRTAATNLAELPPDEAPFS